MKSDGESLVAITTKLSPSDFMMFGTIYYYTYTTYTLYIIHK